MSYPSHPIVRPVLDAAKRISSNNHLTGLTDGREGPVYLTKWLKFGLSCLGLADDCIVPRIEDRYAPLFTWDKKNIVASPTIRYHADAESYPYPDWTEAHFWGDEPPMQFVSNGYPLT